MIKKNILITGGAGFIGSHLVDRLLELNNKVIVVDNLSNGKVSNINNNLGNSDFKFYDCDITNKSFLKAIMTDYKIDIVFHLAANSDISKSHCFPDIDYMNTFKTTYIIMNAMKECNINKIVFASTSAVYGELKGDLSETSAPLFPISHYGAAKVSSEAFISSFVENYNIQAWIFRFPNIVGSRATHGIIYDFISKLRENPNELTVLGDGNQYKPYLYVDDLIDAMLFVYSNSDEKINLFNVGNITRTYVKDIANMVVEEMGLNKITNIKYTGGSKGWIGDVAEFNYCLDKIHKLGWTSKMTSNEAVREAIKCNL